jgi:hypothetical protein
MSSRTPLLSWCSRALAGLLVVGLAACGGGDDDDAGKPQTTPSQKVDVAGAHVSLDLASVDVQAAGEAIPLDDKTKVGVMTQTRQYVEEAVVRPLLKGKKAGGDYTKLFAPGVVNAATKGADRAVLTDEQVGKVSADVRGGKTPVAMHALVASDGTIQFIATDFDLKLRTTVAKQPLTINRNTELTFEKAPNGKWLVTAYRVIVTRLDSSGKKTAAATSTTTGKS